MAWPTSTTVTAGNTITAAGRNALRADLLAINGFVRKTANESVTSSITLQNDDHLALAIPATGTYEFDVKLFATSAANAAGDLLVGFTFPTGTMSVGGLGPDVGLASGGVQTGNWGAVSAYTSGTTFTSYGLSTFDLFIWIHGLLVATATGTLQFQWAQAVSNANASTIKAGSHMTMRQVA